MKKKLKKLEDILNDNNYRFTKDGDVNFLGSITYDITPKMFTNFGSVIDAELVGSGGFEYEDHFYESEWFEKEVTDKELALNSLTKEDIQWVVNDVADLGVKIGNKCFFLYKGRTIVNNGKKYRKVYKREFGESVHPIDCNRGSSNYIGRCGEDENEWFDIKELK